MSIIVKNKHGECEADSIYHALTIVEYVNANGYEANVFINDIPINKNDFNQLVTEHISTLMIKNFKF